MGMADLAKSQAKEQAKDAVKDGIEGIYKNAVGKVCTRVASSQENQTRCKAAERLYEVANNGKDAVAACSASAAGPVGLLALGKCGIATFRTADSTQAMVRQAATGKETKTIEETVKEKAKKMAGAYVAKMYNAWKNAPPIPPENYQFMGP